MSETNYDIGCQMPLEQWIWLNRVGIFEDLSLRKYAAPFPPETLMENVSGLRSEQDFAFHGTDLFVAISKASPKPLIQFEHILDFGCGCGRLARMFKGHPRKVSGCDIDTKHVAFINASFDFMRASLSTVRPPLPFPANEFDAIISISVFTHLNENSQDDFLEELHRVSKPGGYLFLTVHGERALARAQHEEPIWKMISVDQPGFDSAQKAFARGEHAFILQYGHLTEVRKKPSLLQKAKNLLKKQDAVEPFEYGITFIPEDYIRSHWSRWFKIVAYHHGAIHDFQDIVVLSPLDSADHAS